MTAEPVRRPQQVSREVVVETALRLIEENDISALTMRRLAAELGTAVTAIYWHVGNRDALLDLLVDRLLSDLRQVPVRGRGARSRIAAICTEWRQQLWDHPHLIAIAHERGKTAAMFQPMQAALAGELRTVGVAGRDAASVIRSLQIHVVSSVVTERTASRGPATDGTDPLAWPALTDDAELVASLAGPIDYVAVFAVGLDALLDRLLPPKPRGGGSR